MTCREVDGAAIPEVRALVDAVVDEFKFSTRFICPHEPTTVHLCAAHPRIGLQCARCMRLHVERHGDDFEHRCDLCGSVVDLIDGISAALELREVPVQTTRRRRYKVTGPVHVIGMGMCQPCATRRGIAA